LVACYQDILYKFPARLYFSRAFAVLPNSFFRQGKYKSVVKSTVVKNWVVVSFKMIFFQSRWEAQLKKIISKTWLLKIDCQKMPRAYNKGQRFCL